MKDYKLGDLLKKSTETIAIQDNGEYRQVTVKLYGKGVVLRGVKKGSEIGTKKQYIAKTGQLILSKIDARNGAFGLVPQELNGAIVTSDFPLFDCNSDLLNPNYLNYLVRTNEILDACIKASKGTTNRQRLKESVFLKLSIKIPSIEIQEKIVFKLLTIEEKLNSIYTNKSEVSNLSRKILLSFFSNMIKNSTFVPMSQIAPIIRRKANIMQDVDYPELGIRSFGKGTFHKPSIKGSLLGGKKIYEIHPGDLIFSNVFAWEGAVALAQDNDGGRFGSHRFITCLPQTQLVLPKYLLFYFLSPQGIYNLGEASPGGAGRNKTLGLKSLEKIQIPLPNIKIQMKFVYLLEKVQFLNKVSDENLLEANLIIPSLLYSTFNPNNKNLTLNNSI